VSALGPKVLAVVRLIATRLGTELHDGLRVAWNLPARISPSRRERCRVILAALALSTLRMHRPVRIRVLGPHGPRWFIVPDWAGMRVLEEVFSFAEYDVDLPQSPNRILDVGSHIGASILYFALRFPTASVVGVEPSPTLFGVLAANVGDLPNVTLLNVAVASTEGPLAFYEGAASWAGSTRPGDETIDGPSSDVDGVTLDQLLQGITPEILKIDIEGAEFDVIPASRLVGDVTAVLGEIHAPPGSPESERMLARLPDHEIRIGPAAWSGGWHTVFSAIRADRLVSASGEAASR
jgi:FkbM family methyltransferase